jgi:tRNA(Arg) A34 adenosine deaminase TadA
MNVEHSLPAWLIDEAIAPAAYSSDAERMRYVLDLTRRNILEGTGGPFAAAVFERDGGRLVAPGVNRVETLKLSSAHAEVLALTLAQRRLGTYDLAASGQPGHVLVSSAQPCLMCAGALLWSGVVELTYAVTKQDVERVLGFDEGFLPRGWQRQMRRRGIVVRAGILRDEGRSLLRLYRERGGAVYNSRRRVARRG